MFHPRWRAMFALTTLGLVGLLGELPSNSVWAQEKEDASLSVADFKKLATELHVKKQPWATVPWKVSVSEARQVAAKEKKPIFLVVNTGNCLGFV